MASTNDILNINELDVEDPVVIRAFYAAWADVGRFDSGGIQEEMRAEGAIDANGVHISKNVPSDVINPLATVHGQ